MVRWIRQTPIARTSSDSRSLTADMAGFAFAAEDRTRVKHFVLMDASIPGVGPWEEMLKSPLLRHFQFGGPDNAELR